jgi:hypothetical protein
MHLSLAKPIDHSALDPKGEETLCKLNAIQEQILELMKEADKLAQVLRYP